MTLVILPYASIPVACAQFSGDNPEVAVTMLLYFASLSLARMSVAFVLSLLFGLLYGMAAARSAKAERILMPVLDVLQSKPILGFFPAAIYFFIALLEGSVVGVEIAAIFLIFTSMAWNLAFAVYESVSTIPQDLQEATEAFGVRSCMLFRRVLLPACVPKLVYNGTLSWAAETYKVLTGMLRRSV
jgi:NitT/TauT family transport system permease protein